MWPAATALRGGTHRRLYALKAERFLPCELTATVGNPHDKPQVPSILNNDLITRRIDEFAQQLHEELGGTVGRGERWPTIARHPFAVLRRSCPL
jgi:hypothetical protein